MNQQLDANGNVNRELTCQMQFSENLQYEEAAKLVTTSFGIPSLHGLQPLGGGRYQVTFTSRNYVEQAVDKGVAVGEGVLKLDPLSSVSKTIYIRNCPLELSISAVNKIFSQYGSIDYQIMEKDPVRGWFTGLRRMKIRMKTAIPNIVMVGNYRTYVSYKGVDFQCKRCSEPGHIAVNCTAPFCHYCRAYFHDIQVCPKRLANEEKKKAAQAEREELNRVHLQQQLLPSEEMCDPDFLQFCENITTDAALLNLPEIPLKDTRAQTFPSCQSMFSSDTAMQTPSVTPAKTPSKEKDSLFSSIAKKNLFPQKEQSTKKIKTSEVLVEQTVLNQISTSTRKSSQASNARHRMLDSTATNDEPLVPPKSVRKKKKNVKNSSAASTATNSEEENL